MDPYQKLYPQQEAILFDGGLDNKFEKALIPENESPDCLNVEFVQGTVQTRQGSVQLNTTPAGNVAFDGLYTRRDQAGNESMCAFIGGHMLVLNATTFVTVPSAQSVFTIGSRVGVEFQENKMFIGNGGVGPYKWDGTAFTQHGVYAPVQTAITSSGTTGSLTTNGVYFYRYTNVNTALVESNLGPAVTFVASSAGLAAVVTNIASGATASMGISQRWLYRTIAMSAAASVPAAGPAYLRVTKLADVSTTSYTDTTADANLGVSGPLDNGTPPLYNAICFVNGMLFMNDVNNPNFVWYSVPGQPYTVPSTNFFKVGNNTTDLVKGFAAYDNYLVVFCQQSIWINYMPNPADATTWRQIRSNSPFGSISPYCALVCNVQGEDILLHPALLNKVFVGFGALTGTTLDPSVSYQAITTVGSQLKSKVIEPDMFQVPTAHAPGISGIVFKNRAFITLPFGASQTTNNRTYVWDFSMSDLDKSQPATWVPWTGLGYSNAQQFTVYNGKLYACTSDTSGLVYQTAYSGVYNDAGTAINSYWWSKEFSGYFEDTNFTKDFRYVNLLYDLAGGYYMNFTYRTDSDTGSGTIQQVNLNPGGTLWGPGNMTWGVSNWGGGANQTESRIYLGASVRGKRLQFQFSNQNTINQRFNVHRGQFMYNLKGYR